MILLRASDCRASYLAIVLYRGIHGRKCRLVVHAMRAWSSRCVRYRLKSIGHRPSSEGVVRFQERGPLPANTHLLDSIEKIKSASDRGYNAEDKPSDPFKASEDPPTVASPNLAQSPLTDSRLNAARFGHKQPKAEKGELSQFQIELRKNPYGSVNSQTRFLLVFSLTVL